MNKTISIASALLFFMGLSYYIFIIDENNIPVNGEKTQIAFEYKELDLGETQKDIEVNAEFYYTNSGSHNLVIYEVEPTCGCTDVKWNKKPIKPGEKGIINITYDGKNSGNYIKTIKVYGNFKDGIKTLSFKGVIR